MHEIASRPCRHQGERDGVHTHTSEGHTHLKELATPHTPQLLLLLFSNLLTSNEAR